MTQYYDLVMAETLSQYAKDALKESGLPFKGIAPSGASEDERWAIAKEAFYKRPIVAITEWGLIDFDPKAQKTLSGGEALTYNDYLDLMRKSGHSVRQDFEKAYYDASWCSFKGRVERINQKKGTVCFEHIFVSAEYIDGDGFRPTTSSACRPLMKSSVPTSVCTTNTATASVLQIRNGASLCARSFLTTNDKSPYCYLVPITQSCCYNQP